MPCLQKELQMMYYLTIGISSINTSKATRALTFCSNASIVRRMARTMRSASVGPTCAACFAMMLRMSTFTIKSRLSRAASTISRRQSGYHVCLPGLNFPELLQGLSDLCRGQQVHGNLLHTREDGGQQQTRIGNSQ